MPKITREDYQKRINDLEVDDELKISLMEDLADSWIDESEEISKLQEDITRITGDYESLKEKYKTRFFDSEKPEEKFDEEKEIKEEKEEVIDIKEI